MGKKESKLSNEKKVNIFMLTRSFASPEFMLFAVRDLKLYSLDGDSIRDKFYNIDTDGNGGLDYK